MIWPIVHVQSRIWRLFWASPSVHVSGLVFSASVLLLRFADQICPTQDNTVSSCLIDTECDPYCWRTSSSQLQNPTSHSTLILFETNYWVQVDVWSTQRVVDELRTQKSSRVDTYDDLFHLRILFSILISAMCPSTVHESSMIKYLTMGYLENYSSNSFLMCTRVRHQSSSCLHRDIASTSKWNR